MLVSPTFEWRKGNANDGKIIVGFVDDEGGLNAYTVSVAITDPLGVVLCTLAETEVTLAIGGDDNIFVNIPKDAAGNYLQGEYHFNIVYNDGVTNVDRNDVYNFVAYSSPDHLTSTLVGLTAALDCNTELITAKDTTDYTSVEGLSVIDRDLTITPPTVAGVSPTTADADQIQAAVTYTNVPYQASLDVSFEYGQLVVDGVVTFFAFGSANLYVVIDVDCDPNMCSLVKCLSAKFQSLKAKADKLGGWAMLSATERGNFDYAQTLVGMAMQLRTCGENQMAKTYINEAKPLLNCDCGCSDTTGPTPINNLQAVAAQTNLSTDYDGANLVVLSSTGSDATLPVADGSHNGLLSAAYKTSIDDALASLASDITAAEGDITTINNIISVADLIGINGVATASNGSVILGPNTSFYRLNAASANIAVVLDSTQMSIGRLYVLSAFPAAGHSITWTLNGLTTLSTGGTSDVSNLVGSLTEQKNYTVILFRIATTVYVTVLKDTIVTT